MNAAELTAVLFAARTGAHQAHLQTRSYAAHKALNDFYEEILEVTDTFAETYQGVFGLMKFPSVSVPTGDPVQWMERLRKEIKASRNDICRGETMLENIVDEVMGVIAHTLYKLKFLNLSAPMDADGDAASGSGNDGDKDADDVMGMRRWG